MRRWLLNKGKLGRCWHVMLAATLILTTMLGPLGTKTVHAAVVVSRGLPATVSPGASFNVTITFSAPADNFNAIGLTDFAPTSWNATVNVAWCNPTPMDSLATGNKAEYVWAGPYTSGTAITAVYQVAVPANAPPGSYNFGNGRLEYYLGGTGPFTDNITGASSVTVLGVSPAVSRALPASVSPGASFNVTISFSAPADNFNAIGLTDFAPTSWNATVNVAWCNPTPMDSLATGNKAEYVWAGPYILGTAITAVYQVTVPANASPGSYNFGNGRLEYYLGATGPFTDNITGDSSVTVGVPLAPPVVTTNAATNITTTSATLSGNLTSLGSFTSANISFEYGTSSGNLTQFTTPVAMTSIGAFSATLSGLSSNTTYYFRAKATADSVIVYGGELSFTTLGVPPTTPVVSRALPATVSPGASFNVTITFSAPANNFNAIGLTDFAPTSWNATVNVAWCNPTPMDSLATGNKAEYVWAGPYTSGTALTAVYQVAVPANAPPGSYNFGNGTLEYYLGSSGPFTDNITGDSSVTVGVPLTPPAVTTTPATNITTTSATLSGNLTSLGNYTPVSVSFVWGQTQGGPYPNPTTPVVMTSIGAFSANISGLSANITYYFRAKAVADNVTVFGGELSFTTMAVPVLLPPAVTTTPATNITTTSATLSGNLTSRGDYTTVNVSFVWGQTQGGPYPNTTTPQARTTIGAFSANISGLSANITYYFRAKAVADNVTVFGGELSFTTAMAITVTQISLVEGLNLVVLPAQPTTPFTSETLLQVINAQGGGATEMYSWDKLGQGWNSYIYGLPFGIWNIETGQGYFIKTTKASTLTFQSTPLPLPIYIFSPRATNISNAKFTISWTTDSAVTGWIEYGTNPASLSPAYDVRGQAVSSYTHYVTVTALTSNTLYYYDVISGGVRDDNNGAHYTVTTGPTLTPPATDAIYGQVFKSDNTTAAAGTIVYITTQGAQVLSSLVASSGYWNINLAEIRTAALSAYFSYTSITLLSINAEGGPVDGRASLAEEVRYAKPATAMGLSIGIPIGIVEGLNFIVLPGRPGVTGYTSETLLAAINEQGGGATEMYSWDKFGQGWNSYIYGLPFGIWNIETVQAYFIKTTKASTFNFVVAP